MKKKLAMIVMTLVVLASVIIPTLVFAQDQVTTAPVRPIKDGLAIVAPRVAAVGQKISITVFKCSDQTPISGAGIWALTPEKMESLKAQISNNKVSDNQEVQDTQYENFLDANGAFLGRTDASGKIWHSFNDDGHYMLVTFKTQYWPDIRQITVGTPSATASRLVIDAPKRAEVGEKITIAVTEKNTQDPVKDAGVWAVTKEKAESLKAAIADVKASGDTTKMQAQIENALQVNAIFLGTTNGAGKVQYAFDKASGYLLVTFKPGYLVGFKPILIGTTPKVLAIDAPAKAKIGEKVTITVSEKNTQDPVKDAGVWAITREKAESLKTEITAAKTSGDQTTIQSKVESILKAQGIFLGTTNGAGKVQYAFDKAGGSVLVTFKPGYWLALKIILIVDNTTQVTTDKTNSTAVK